ncbi:ribose 5-phosphate isomerase B [Patescibacteria group bacterium]
MKIFIASDHGGYKLKEVIKEELKALGNKLEDLGTNSEESVDYPDFAQKLCKKVLDEKARGILICGTGIGMSIAANKFEGIRAAVCTDSYMAQMSKEHNDSNVLCLGARVMDEKSAKKIVKVWVKTECSNEERHGRRVGKIGSTVGG